MNNRHLPAGQAMQGTGGHGPDMGHVNSGPRGPRRAYNSQSYLPQQQPAPTLYPGYNMGGHPAAHHYNQNFYQHMNLPYVPQGMGMHQQQQYMPYGHQHQQAAHHHQQSYAARSPPARPIQQQHYAPIVTSGMGQPSYARQNQHSPAIPAAYQPPPPPQAAVIHHSSHTPTSTHSTQAVAPPPPAATTLSGPATTTSPGNLSQIEPAASTEAAASAASSTPKQSTPSQHPAQSAVELDLVTPVKDEELEKPGEPFRPPLPWYSHPDQPFPVRTKKKRRRVPAKKEASVQLPSAQTDSSVAERAKAATKPTSTKSSSIEARTEAPKADAIHSTARPDTPSTSENAPSTSPTSPSSAQASVGQPISAFTSSASIATNKPSAPRTAVPAVPVVPAVPKKEHKQAATEKASSRPAEHSAPEPQRTDADDLHKEQTTVPAKPAHAAPPKPKTWSGLFANKTPMANPAANGACAVGTSAAQAQVAGSGSGQAGSGAALSKSGPASVADALRSYKVGGAEQIAFLEPRGLINTGNMCYMNSVLQVLIFCVPFYDFLHQVYKKAAHSFKSETPLIDAMVMFMNEFNIVDSATSVETLRRRLKPEHLEKFGEPFTPEFVYDAIKKLPRFASMRRGHQQDAEEFLGFLLESLHDECIHAMRVVAETSSSTTSSSPISAHEAVDANGWMEVGYRQKPTVTRSSGHPQLQSPITKIFGGQLRSELRVPGLKDSVTLEPYQPLQLDITANNVRNIVDALKGLTNSERLQGDFKSPRGKDANATKQVFIETLPPVLILHLKRFQFDAEGNGTVKVWKKIGYPLELEIPKEVFPRGKRNTMTSEGVGGPRYKLSAVVYHHGKNASGGHYTVDVRRQDGTEWIRLDDTVIKRIRSEDVAEGGAEEDARSAGTEGRKDGIVGGTGNRFSGVDNDESGDDDGWKHVPPAANGKRWSSVLNGGQSAAGAPTAKKPARDNIKDNKVAYLLFYQRI
ncbi:hypothetical protein MKZ38_004142 [Zalerion maritima]|uniref:Ubiquitin carboxyl-terminal hydrolase n=1 Tax=Zalerion maritima TaxID=339359 RepID=A0AAD5RMI3_9PEZI|nr:hypothetical protein MKZ38_004142 [Zalerion maritima]